MLRYFALFGLVVASLFAANESPLDRPLKIESGTPGAVPGAITAVDLQGDDFLCFGEAVNALREELRLHVAEADIRTCEELFFAGLTPRQILLIGLPVYKRQNHAPEAGKGAFAHWAPAYRMSDLQIGEAMKRYAKKANQLSEPTAASGRGSP